MNNFFFYYKFLGKLFLSIALLFSYFGIVDAATIESKSTGGYWISGATWVGGVVPGIGDDVVINGNVTYGEIYRTVYGNLTINEGGKLYSFNSNSTINLTVNGNLINNGILGGSLSSWRGINVHILGKTINNGEISNVKLIIYDDIENNGAINSGFYLGKDVEIIKKQDFNTTIYLNGYKLKVQNNTYISSLSGNGEINSSTSENGDGEYIYFSSTTGNIKSNFEYMNSKNNINSGFIVRNTIIDSSMSSQWLGTVNGNLIIREEGYLYGANWNTTPNLIINGDLINNGTLGGSLTTWRQFNTYVKGTILNNGTISNIYNFYIYGDFENNGIFSTSSTKLAWDSFGGYNDYYINLSYNTGSVEVNNSTSYNIPLTKLTSGESITWNVLGNGLIYDNPDGKGDRCINVPGCVNISTEQLIIPIPAYLKQYIKSPLLDEEEILVGSKIGKFQSGSGVILEAVIENNTENEYNLVFDVYRLGFVNPQYTEKVQIKSGTGRIIVPFLGAGDYSWNVRVETLDGSNSSEIVELMGNYSFETDYSIFEGFEPYPYGYNFYNRGVENLVLTGGINYSFNPVDLLISRQKKDGNKWEIFNSAFELSGYTDEQLLDAFEYLGLNKDTAFQNGNCYGMAVSATMQYKHPEFLENYFSGFSTKIGTGSIWSNIESPSTTSTGEWDIYNDTLKTILTEHLSQYSFNDRISLFNGYSSGTTILSELTNNPDNTYIIAFLGKDKDGNVIGHGLVPYRVEGNKIYVWDNNIEYPYYESYDKIINKNEKIFSYSQYITINNDGTYDIPYYTKIFNSFDEISLINIDDIYNNGNRSGLIGFLSFDILYTLDGKSDLLVTDSEGRISGFSGGTILDEIPGVQVIIPLTNTFTLSTENTWKQIYLPQKIDNLTIKVNGKTEENYDLMIAGGDYYTKLEGISTSSGQIDTFNISRENIKIDLDDNKTSTGTYNLLIDNFQDTGTGTVYVDSVKLNTNPQQYNVNWSEVINNTNTAVNYQIDTNNDGIYNESISVPVITSGESLIGTETPIEKYIFPSQTISYDSGQQTAISGYQTIVGNYEGFTWGEDISFTTGGQGNPTVQTSNGNRASSGTFRGGLNILMDVPPRGESYTGYVDIAGVRLEFTVTRDPLPPLDVGILDFGIKTVNYGGSVYSNRVSFPFVPEETEFRLIGEGNPTVLTSNGTRSNTGSVRYGTNIEVEIPAIGQTRVIEFSILGQTGRFTVTRE